MIRHSSRPFSLSSWRSPHSPPRPSTHSHPPVRRLPRRRPPPRRPTTTTTRSCGRSSRISSSSICRRRCRCRRTRRNFHLTHRFNEDLRGDSFGTQAEQRSSASTAARPSASSFRFGVMKHLEAIVARTNIGKTIQFSAQVRRLAPDRVARRSALSAIVCVEGEQQLPRNTSGATSATPAVGAVVSRTLGDRRGGLCRCRSGCTTRRHRAARDTQNTFFIGLGGRVRLRGDDLRRRRSVAARRRLRSGDAEVRVRASRSASAAHVFSLDVREHPATTYGQIARGGCARHSPVSWLQPGPEFY